MLRRHLHCDGGVAQPTSDFAFAPSVQPAQTGLCQLGLHKDSKLREGFDRMASFDQRSREPLNRPLPQLDGRWSQTVMRSTQTKDVVV